MRYFFCQGYKQHYSCSAFQALVDLVRQRVHHVLNPACEKKQLAFEALYKRHKNRVYGYMSQKISADKIDDVFQLVFAKLHQKKHLYKKEYPFLPWFYTLIKNTLIDFCRKEKIIFEKLSSEPIAHEHSNETELNLNLKEEEYQLLYAKFVEGFGYKELEEEFNASASTLRKRVSRLIATIRKRNSYE